MLGRAPRPSLDSLNGNPLAADGDLWPGPSGDPKGFEGERV